MNDIAAPNGQYAFIPWIMPMSPISSMQAFPVSRSEDPAFAERRFGGSDLQ